MAPWMILGPILGHFVAVFPLPGPRDPQKEAQERPRAARELPKSRPKGPKKGQEAAKKCPRRAKERPRRGQEGTKAAPRETPKNAKRAQDMPREPRSMVAAVTAMADRSDGDGGPWQWGWWLRWLWWPVPFPECMAPRSQIVNYMGSYGEL